jgi:hypothetical protein
MKHHLIPVGIALFLIFFSVQSFGQTTMMSSNPLKKNEVLLYNTYQFYENTSKYNWNIEQWDDLNDSLGQSFHKDLPMVGYGITNKLAFYAQFPMQYFEQDQEYQLYFNDILLMSRYAIIPSSGSKSGLTLIGALRLPTAKTGEKNYSDGSWDFIVGEIYSTKWYNNWRTHIKSDFTFNTKNIDDAKSGNDLNIFLKQDYKLGKIKFALVNQYYHHFKNENNKGEIVDNTQKNRLTHLMLVKYRMANGLILKPKFQIPSYVIGGSKYDYKFVFEVYYRFLCKSRKNNS